LSKSGRLKELPLLLGATATIQGWQWLDKTPVYSGEWLSGHRDEIIPGSKQFLVWDHGFWRSISAGDTIPLLLVKYKSDHKFNAQQINANSPLILKKHSLNGKTLWILRAPVDWFTAKRLAEMLGGRLAVPQTPEESAAMLDMCKDFSNLHLAIGGYRMCDRWQYLDGQTVQDIPDDRSNRRVTHSNCFVTLYENRLCNSEKLDGFICEFPQQ
jgi:hypothetical protein